MELQLKIRPIGNKQFKLAKVSVPDDAVILKEYDYEIVHYDDKCMALYTMKNNEDVHSITFNPTLKGVWGDIFKKVHVNLSEQSQNKILSVDNELINKGENNEISKSIEG